MIALALRSLAELVRGICHALVYIALTSLGLLWLVGPGAFA